MNTIPKDKLDELIALERQYYKTGDIQLVTQSIEKGEEIAAVVFNKKIYWSGFKYFVGSIVGCYGMMPDATNDDIYNAFEAIGFTVQDINYRGVIKIADSDSWLESEYFGKYTTTTDQEKALQFFDESDAVSTVEYLNDSYEECFVLVDVQE